MRAVPPRGLTTACGRFLQSVEELMDKTIPASIRLRRPLRIDDHVCK